MEISSQTSRHYVTQRAPKYLLQKNLNYTFDRTAPIQTHYVIVYQRFSFQISNFFGNYYIIPMLMNDFMKFHYFQIRHRVIVMNGFLFFALFIRYGSQNLKTRKECNSNLCFRTSFHSEITPNKICETISVAQNARFNEAIGRCCVRNWISIKQIWFIRF